MAGEDAAETWYVRARGRVLGPLTWEQLLALRERGQLARFDQVSRDRQEWVAADSLERLFPRGGAAGAFIAGAGARQPGADRPGDLESDGLLILDDEDGGGAAPGPAARAGAPADEPAGWYYAEAGTPQGPVGFGELRRLARDGRIGPSTLYWRSGLEQWTTGSDLSELGRLWPDEDAPGAGPTAATLPPRDRKPGPAGAVATPRVLPLAIASLTLNLLCGVGNLAAIAAGVMALRQSARSNGTRTEKRLALGGILLGVVGVIGSAMAFAWIFGRRTE
jgi:GYF domain 2